MRLKYHHQQTKIHLIFFCIYKVNKFIHYPYLVIRGNTKHVNKVLSKNECKPEDEIISIKAPSGINFYNKVKKYHGSCIYCQKNIHAV